MEEIQKEKEILYQEGVKKIECLKKVRNDLNKLHKQYNEVLNNQLSLKIEKLENELASIIVDITKIDTALKILDAIEYILENNIFGDKWNAVTSKIKFEEFMDIVIDEDFDLASIYKKLYYLAEINDKKILKKIEDISPKLTNGLKAEHDIDEDSSIIRRIKKIKKFLR